MSRVPVDKPDCDKCGRPVDAEVWHCDEPGCKESVGDCCADDWQEGREYQCWCPAHCEDE